MKQSFVSSWKASKQPRKQHKYRHNAPLHLRKRMIASHLSKELRKKHGIRSIAVRKGDTIKIMRGQFKNKTGKIERILLKDYKVYVAGVERAKRDGTKSPYPLDPSNVLITELVLSDKQRLNKVKRKNGTTSIKSQDTKELADTKKAN